MDDAALVQQAVGGDRDAFAAIYDRYAPRLYDFLRSLLRDAEEAADVLHDTFMVAGARLHQLRDPSKLRPWLYAIARHQGLRVLERRVRHEPLGDGHSGDRHSGTRPSGDRVTAIAEDPTDAVAGEELAALVAAAAEGLGPRDRVVLDLHLRQGLEGQELAEAMGVSVSHAYVLLSRLRDQVERSLGAILVARQGRDDCDGLAAVLAGWDGRFTPVWRKRVARHADRCQVCGDRRRRSLTPAALLGGAAPAFALPADLRGRVLADVELCSYKGSAWPGGRDGFPPPLVRPHRRRPALAAALAAMTIVAGTVLTLGEDASPPETLSAGGPTLAPTTTAAPTTLAEATAPVDQPGGQVPSAVTPTVRPTGPVATVDAGPPPTTRAPTPTSPPGDTEPPVLSALRVSPPTVQAGPGCANRDPRTATASVQASDDSGIAHVELTVDGSPPATVEMARTGGDLFEAVIGPFAGTRGETSGTIRLTARAADGSGNLSTATGMLAWRCDPSSTSGPAIRG